MLVVSAAVGFLLWYSLARDAQEIQPLVPALQSWWMKIHVPANFIGYGTFSLSAMVAFAYLMKERGVLADRLPSLEVLDDMMYKSITVGFAFFTIATVLGALWAADAWGGYWSWDPKETWALIVWLNYAAWLHMRLVKGLRGTVAAWWALAGLVVTTFAFLGVNMFLSACTATEPCRPTGLRHRLRRALVRRFFYRQESIQSFAFYRWRRFHSQSPSGAEKASSRHVDQRSRRDGFNIRVRARSRRVRVYEAGAACSGRPAAAPEPLIGVDGEAPRRRRARHAKRRLRGATNPQFVGAGQGHAVQGRDHLQQLLRVRHRQGRSGAERRHARPPLDRLGRRPGQQARSSRHRRPAQARPAGRTHLPAALRRGLVDGDSLGRLFAGGADQEGEPTGNAKYVEFITLDDPADAGLRRRPCSTGPTPRACAWTRRCIR